MRRNVRLLAVAPMLLPWPAAAQVVQGQVIDSVTTANVLGAAVALVDFDGREIDRTTTDGNGQFLLYGPTPGQYRLAVRMDGFKPSTFPAFSLGAEDTKAFTLLLARLTNRESVSAAELVNGVCERGSVDGESGTILGVVRDQAGQPVVDGDVIVAWPAVSGGFRNLINGDALDDVMVAVRTDSAGFFAACDVPAETNIRFHAVHEGQVSDLVLVRFRRGGVEQGEQVFPTDDALWVQQLIVLPSARRLASASGVIRTRENGMPLPGAEVELLGTQMRTTADSTGRFSFEHLPDGFGKIRVRAIGYYASDVEVRLQAGVSTMLPAENLSLAKAPTELEPIEVTATAPEIRRPLRDFMERRDEHVGMFITREEFLRQGNPQIATDVLRRMGGIKILPNPGYTGESGSPRFRIVLTRNQARATFGLSSSGPGCAPIAFLDGHYLGRTNGIDVDRLISLDFIVAVEAYASTASMPIEFNRPGATCGAIAFWTR